MKKRTLPASRHLAGLPRDWRPCSFVITRLRSGSSTIRPARPAPPPQAKAATAGSAHPVATPVAADLMPIDLSAITLHQILDTFGRLDDPQGRVFAGLVPATPLAPTGFSLSPLPDGTGLATAPAPAAITGFGSHRLPMVSGFAPPGSRVGVQFTDELGITQDRVTVHADEHGHWIALPHDVPRLLDTRAVRIEIVPPHWSGESRAEYFTVPFPSTELASQIEAPGGLVGSVIPALRTSQPAPTGSDW